MESPKFLLGVHTKKTHTHKHEITQILDREKTNFSARRQSDKTRARESEVLAKQPIDKQLTEKSGADVLGNLVA